MELTRKCAYCCGTGCGSCKDTGEVVISEEDASKLILQEQLYKSNLSGTTFPRVDE